MHICVYAVCVCFVWVPCVALPSSGGSSVGSSPLCGSPVCGVPMLNTRNEEYNAVFYSYLACVVNTSTLNIYVSMAYTGWTRWNTVFICLWLRHRNA